MKKIRGLLLALRHRFALIYTRDYEQFRRRRISKRNLKKIGSCSIPLTSDEREEILSFWKPYRNVKKELGWFEFYKASCEDLSQLKYYLPDTIYYSEIDTFFNNPRRCITLDNKNLYDLFYHDVRMPRTVIRKINGELFDQDYHLITFEQAYDICRQAKAGVGKMATHSSGGHWMKFFDFTTCSTQDLKKYLEFGEDLIIQEIIQQHEFFNNIHANSINTIRIMTLFLNGETVILSSILRMGAGGSRVDNGSSGGVFCGVNLDGTLMEIGHYTDGRKCTQHPQGTVFKGLKVVGYERCCNLAKELAFRMFTSTRLISWDFAVGPDGEPILIEVNLTYGGLSTHQLSRGPLYGDRTPEILSLVYSSRKNKIHSLYQYPIT